MRRRLNEASAENVLKHGSESMTGNSYINNHKTINLALPIIKDNAGNEDYVDRELSKTDAKNVLLLDGSVKEKGALDLTTSARLSTSTTSDFQINDVSRALVPHVGFRQRG